MMSPEEFLEKLAKNPVQIDFNELIAMIDANYDFTPTAFQNGSLHNAADENNGSCKLFYFAYLHGLSETDTLQCFGDYYRQDVLLQPDGSNHQNIRNFLQTGWQGINFAGTPLTPRKK